MKKRRMKKILNAVEAVCEKYTDLQVGLYNPPGTEFEFIMFLTPEGDALYLSQVADIDDPELSYQEAREVSKGLAALGL